MLYVSIQLFWSELAHFFFSSKILLTKKEWRIHDYTSIYLTQAMLNELSKYATCQYLLQPIQSEVIDLSELLPYL